MVIRISLGENLHTPTHMYHLQTTFSFFVFVYTLWKIVYFQISWGQVYSEMTKWWIKWYPLRHIFTTNGFSSLTSLAVNMNCLEVHSAFTFIWEIEVKYILICIIPWGEVTLLSICTKFTVSASIIEKIYQDGNNANGMNRTLAIIRLFKKPPKIFLS